MKIFLSSIVSFAVGSLLVFMFFNYNITARSNINIDSDIALCKDEISRIDKELSKYSGGLYYNLMLLQRAIYGESIAALEQKRFQLVHWINFTYSSEKKSHLPIGNQDQLDSDIASIKKSINDGIKESAQYKPCLVKSLIDARVATDQFTLAGLQRAKIANRYELPILLFPQERSGGKAEESPSFKQSPELDFKAL